MTTIVPATMPAPVATAGVPAVPPPVVSVGAAGTDAAAMAGSGAGSAGDLAASAGSPAAGTGAAGAAGQMASTGFDPATFDEAHGRSRRTAPLGTPLEMGGMQCPNEVCKPLPALPAQAASAGVSVGLCCTAAGECGTKGSAPMSMVDPNECRVIPDSDPQCARLELMGFEIASCCTAEGKCGLNGESFMMKPCGSIEEAMMSAFGSFVQLPPPASCVPGMGPPGSTSAPAPGTPASGAAGTGASAPAAGSSASSGAAGSRAP